MVTDVDLIQPDASVTATEYVPAARFVAVAVVCTGVVVHANVYGETPPLTSAAAVPVASPKQETFVLVVVMTIGAEHLPPTSPGRCEAAAGNRFRCAHHRMIGRIGRIELEPHVRLS